MAPLRNAHNSAKHQDGHVNIRERATRAPPPPTDVHSRAHLCTRAGQRARALTTVDAEVLLQVMLVFKGFATFTALEFAIASQLCDVSLEERGGAAEL